MPSGVPSSGCISRLQRTSLTSSLGSAAVIAPSVGRRARAPFPFWADRGRWRAEAVGMAQRVSSPSRAVGLSERLEASITMPIFRSRNPLVPERDPVGGDGRRRQVQRQFRFPARGRDRQVLERREEQERTLDRAIEARRRLTRSVGRPWKSTLASGRAPFPRRRAGRYDGGRRGTLAG
jgi:hypothetical protein